MRVALGEELTQPVDVQEPNLSYYIIPYNGESNGKENVYCQD